MEEIVKTTFGLLGNLDIAQARDRFGELADLGIDLAIVDLPDPFDREVYHFLAELVVEVSPMGRATPTLLSRDRDELQQAMLAVTNLSVAMQRLRSATAELLRRGPSTPSHDQHLRAGREAGKQHSMVGRASTANPIHSRRPALGTSSITSILSS